MWYLTLEIFKGILGNSEENTYINLEEEVDRRKVSLVISEFGLD